MDKSDFKVLVRRVPGYEPTLSVRFEMSEGYGELHVGERRRASPSAAGEVAEVSGEAVRGGRFVHVLASGRRRQSYAFSRLDDDRLQQLPDDQWTELTPVTEFGIRYLELPSIEAPTTAAIQVSASPAPSRTATPPGAGESSLLARARSRARSSSASSDAAGAAVGTSRSANPAPARASAPARAGAAAVRASTASPAVARPRTPTPGSSARPAPARAASPVAPHSPAPRGMAVEVALGRDAVNKLSEKDLRERLIREMAKVESLHLALEDAERRLEESASREADLVAVIAKWSERG